MQSKMDGYFRGKGFEKTLKTWEADWESPLGADKESLEAAEMFKDLESRAATPSLEPKISGSMKGPGVPRELSKFGLDETVQLQTKVLGAGDEEADLSVLSAASKTKLGMVNLNRPLAIISPCVEVLTRDVKSYGGIHRAPLESCHSLFHPHVKTVRVRSGSETAAQEPEHSGFDVGYDWLKPAA